MAHIENIITEMPKEPSMPPMRNRDIVSGKYFRSFVDAYKDYDAKQKRIIREQSEKINYLYKLLEKNLETEGDETSATRLGNIIHLQCDRIHKLKEENERLFIKLCELQQRIQTY